MPTLFRAPDQTLRRAVAATLLPIAAVLLAPAAQAGPLVFAPFSGTGNAVLFDPSTGSGGWVGSIEQFPEPGLTNPLSLVSVVIFSFDAVAGTLTGDFTFNRSSDLGATLFGMVSGTTSDADLFGTGGQLSLDYTVQGGTGDYAGFSGYGLSFLNYDPNGVPDNYSEDGLLVLAAAQVPEPGSMALAAAALLALAMTGRRQSRRTAPGAATQG